MENLLGIDTSHTALVVEGGGMRGVFTAGVLDYFLDQKIDFPYNIGVSAGAGNVLNYMAKQRGRTKIQDIDYLEKYNYIGLHKLITKGAIMDYDLLFREFAFRIYPYDFDTYAQNPYECEIVTCDCRTGEALYVDDRKDHVRLNDLCRASCSLPFVSPKVYVDGVPMLDGGICDAIPYERAFAKGYDRVVIILTRPRGYRKSEKGIRFPNFVYSSYPKLQEKLRQKNADYNRLMDEIEQSEDNADGRMFVIRPEDTMGVERLEKNPQKLTALYEHGLKMAEKIVNLDK